MLRCEHWVLQDEETVDAQALSLGRIAVFMEPINPVILKSNE